MLEKGVAALAFEVPKISGWGGSGVASSAGGGRVLGILEMKELEERDAQEEEEGSPEPEGEGEVEEVEVHE